jgi:DNA-binding IclR family transcriptional regulator
MSRLNAVPRQGDGGSIQLIAKVAAILDAMTTRPELTVGDLSDLVGEPRSSLYRIIQSLEVHGLVESGSRRGTYRLGLKLLEYGGAVQNHFDIRHSALPLLESLLESTGESVFLCVRRGDSAVCIERLAGQRVQILALQLGGALPLHTGAAPRALLAFEPEGEWEAYWDRQTADSPRLASFTDFTPVTKAALFEALGNARNAGLAISDQDVTVGVAALGVPILDRHGKPCASVSLSGTRESILGKDFTELEKLLKAAGHEISKAMGYRPTTAAAAVGEE